MRKDWEGFYKYQREWRERNKMRVKGYHIKHWVRLFLKIKKEGKLEEFGLKDLDKELKEIYSSVKRVVKKRDEVAGIDDSIIYESLGKLKEEIDYLTTKEAGEILGVSERTIQRRIKAGEIRAIDRKELGLKGRGWLIPREEIERLKSLEKG